MEDDEEAIGDIKRVERFVRTDFLGANCIKRASKEDATRAKS